jgi:hypothetical protein
MNIKIVKYIRDDEILESVHFQNDNGDDYLILPYYVNNITTSAEKNLRLGIDYLPQMIEQVFKAGKDGEKLNIKVEELNV